MKKSIKHLTKITLESIFNDLMYKNLEETSIVSEAEITFKNEIYGYVKYSVSINDNSKHCIHSYDDVQDVAELNFTLNSAMVELMYSSNNKLVNVTKALNEALLDKQFTNLSY